MKHLIFAAFLSLTSNSFAKEFDPYKKEILIQFIEEIASEFSVYTNSSIYSDVKDIYSEVGYPALYDFTYFVENGLLSEALLYKGYLIELFPEWENLVLEELSKIESSELSYKKSPVNEVEPPRIPRDVPSKWVSVFDRARDACYSGCNSRNSARNIIVGATVGSLIGGLGAGTLTGAAAVDLLDCAIKCGRGAYRSTNSRNRGIHGDTHGYWREP